MDPFATTITPQKPKVIGGFETEGSEIKKDRLGFYDDEPKNAQSESYGEWVGYISFKKSESFAESFLSKPSTSENVQHKPETPKIEIKSVATAAVGEAFSGMASAAENTTKVAMKATKSVGEALSDLFELVTGRKMPLIEKFFNRSGESKPKAEKPVANDPKSQAEQKAEEIAQFRAAKMRETQGEVMAVEQKKIQDLTKDALRILGAGLEEVADMVDAKTDVAQTKSFIAKIGSGMSNISKITRVGKNSITLAKQKTSWAQVANKKAAMSASAKGGMQAVNMHGIAEGSTGGASSNLSSTGGGAG